jgi:hypothetical protein
LKHSTEQIGFQFSLSAALKVLTLVGILLGVGVLLPPGLRRFGAAALAITIGSAIVFLVLWLAEQSCARFGGHLSLPIGSMMLVSLSVFIIILILLPLPGGRGPVQLAATNEISVFVFDIRGVAMLELLFSPMFCGLIGKVRLEMGMPARFGWLIAAIVSYVLAWYLVGTYEFSPTV